ncbi:MAG: cupin domain-containing protein [Sphingobacteriales bacterium]|nr:MAG: cupin domain-containing protein [Sphingobacteriales bacterium]
MNEPCNINTMGTNAVIKATTTKQEGADNYTEMLAALPKCTEEKGLHKHPLQTVRLEPIEGKLGIMMADRRLIIKPGRSFEIPRNTEYAFYNADEKVVKFKTTLTPALHTEWLTKELVASAKRKKSKIRSAIEQSYIISQIKGEYYRSGLPVAIQNIVHPALALVAKMLGVHKQISPLY